MTPLRTASLLAMALLSAGCASQTTPDEPIVWSAQWFQCDSRFECIAVQDAYCKHTAVNANYSLVYQDWARQQVESIGEIAPCDRDSEQDRMPIPAVCHNNTCEHPGHIE
ncbi:MAG: hypothetical protein RIA65_05810 [Woeseia sp.]